ncbi:hypothetical protein KQI68_02025 [Peptoniphilus sp. MSJ-1]|uniref:Uncharacterized protein n=1 Tax=Peptoniphilus ovalis TaxID=2841503 RepID=A0ABS6FH79_9FIRM|nr:hypothetical protein [Peptoniphilus ovalis]MBU5668611.1 hypothetical protein [Peptoniphilus ovalis]
MNREYLIINIALGATTAERNNIILTEKEKERIKRYQEIARKADEEGSNIIFYAPDED